MLTAHGIAVSSVTATSGTPGTTGNASDLAGQAGTEMSGELLSVFDRYGVGSAQDRIEAAPTLNRLTRPGMPSP